jgi:putative endonuclease
VRRSFSEGGPSKAQSYGGQANLQMFYVYLLKSESHPKQPYVGSTRDLRQRLRDHNEGRCPHTAKFRPWTLIAYFAFLQERTAIAFEKYLKSGSGRAFINRHFL